MNGITNNNMVISLSSDCLGSLVLVIIIASDCLGSSDLIIIINVSCCSLSIDLSVRVVSDSVTPMNCISSLSSKRVWRVRDSTNRGCSIWRHIIGRSLNCLGSGVWSSWPLGCSRSCSWICHVGCSCGRGGWLIRSSGSLLGCVSILRCSWGGLLG